MSMQPTRYEHELDEVREQRDELLAALKALVGVFEIRDFVRPQVALARQVIAKVGLSLKDESGSVSLGISNPTVTTSNSSSEAATALQHAQERETAVKYFCR
jgi:hypothetical protein